MNRVAGSPRWTVRARYLQPEHDRLRTAKKTRSVTCLTSLDLVDLIDLVEGGELDAPVCLPGVDLVLGVALVVGELQLRFAVADGGELVAHASIA